MLRVIEYCNALSPSRSLKVIRNDTLEKGASPYSLQLCLYLAPFLRHRPTAAEFQR